MPLSQAALLVMVFTLLTFSQRLVLMLTIVMLVLNPNSYFCVKLLLVRNNKSRPKNTIRSMWTLTTNFWRDSTVLNLLVRLAPMRRRILSYLMVLLFPLDKLSISMKNWKQNWLLKNQAIVLLRKLKRLRRSRRLLRDLWLRLFLERLVVSPFKENNLQLLLPENLFL